MLLTPTSVMMMIVAMTAIVVAHAARYPANAHRGAQLLDATTLPPNTTTATTTTAVTTTASPISTTTNISFSNTTVAPTTTTNAPPTPAPGNSGDVVYGNITASYSNGVLGRVQTDLLKAMGVTLAFVILALLEATLPKTNVQVLSRSEMMGLEAHLLDNDGDDLLGASLRSGSPGGGSFAGPSKSLIVGSEQQQHTEKLPPSPVNNGSIVATSGQQPRLVLPTAAPPPPPLPHQQQQQQQQQSVPSAAQQQNQPQHKRSAADIDDPIRFADDDEEDGVELNAML